MLPADVSQLFEIIRMGDPLWMGKRKSAEKSYLGGGRSWTAGKIFRKECVEADMDSWKLKMDERGNSFST
jgi:hypothetical protein